MEPGITKRMGKHDIASALTFLRRQGYDIHAAPEPEVRGKFDIVWPARPTAERLSARDVWMLTRGMRVGITLAQREEAK